MDRSPTLLFIIGTLALITSQTVALNLLNDFNTSSHGWGTTHKNWIWTGEPGPFPNTTNIPSFYSDGNFYWSESLKTQKSNSTVKRLHLTMNDVVLGNSKFYFRIWYYTTKPDKYRNLTIYIMNEVKKQTGKHLFRPLATINDNTNAWKDVIVDCSTQDCCQWKPPATTTTTTRASLSRLVNARGKRNAPTQPLGNNCNVKMNIHIGIQLTGSSGEYSFAAIRCVSSGDNRCPNSSTTTTTSAPIIITEVTERFTKTPMTTSPEANRTMTAATPTAPIVSSTSAITTVTTAVRALITTKKPVDSLSVPFTHDFKISRRGWALGNKMWVWSGKNDHYPNTTNIPSFYNEGNFVWTKSTQQRLFGKHKKLRSPPISGVTNSTKFHIRYWFSSSKPSQKQGLLIYLDDVISKPKKHLPLVTVRDSRGHWDDVTIDCQLMKCCDHYNCNLRIKFAALFEKSERDGLAAIQCVSTDDNRSGPFN